MKIPIAFADLTYTNQNISNVSFPFGISLVGSYSKKILENRVEIGLFKYPDDFKNYLETENPRIVGFSNFSWTFDLSYSFAKKIKENNLNIIIVFGGPNYPIEYEKQKKFLKSYPAIDFYIMGEGEKSFVELFESLEKFNFRTKDLKNSCLTIGNCYYINNEKIIQGPILPRLENLDDIPSPYLSGMVDKFFDAILTPVVQTTRGCPFHCAYCQEGQDYFNQIARFSPKRVREDLEYIAKKVKVPNLLLIDSNFGMYEEDLKTCENISIVKEKYNWPKHIEASLGKNKKRVAKAVGLLKEDIVLDIPVQSTDANVLKNIKRKNISLEKMIEIANLGNSFSEVILALPGDSKESHFKSMFDMIDIGTNVVRSHQLLMLAGSEISTEKYRNEFGMVSAFRIQPKCFGEYELYGKTFPVAEIDEVCISNNTMNYKDYLECRALDLTIELFYNNGIFQELINFLKNKKISASSLIREVHKTISNSKLNKLYQGFLKETKESFCINKTELENFIKSPGKVREYIEKGLRNNEQLKYRAIGFFQRMRDLHEVAFLSAKNILSSQIDEEDNKYLRELHKFSLLRKEDVLSTEETRKNKFNYDFSTLFRKEFDGNPLDYILPEKKEIIFFHSQEQKELISNYINLFGSSINCLGFILSRSHANKFYRKICLL